MSVTSPFQALIKNKLIFSLVCLFIAGTPAFAGDLNLDVQLIWGTNDEKSPNPKHKPVEASLDKKLKKIFKWKNYFEVNRQHIDIPSRQMRKAVMSDKCWVEIQELEGPRVEVRLFGEGKLINKTVKTLDPGELLTLAGDDKNESAWFVIIKEDKK